MNYNIWRSQVFQHLWFGRICDPICPQKFIMSRSSDNGESVMLLNTNYMFWLRTDQPLMSLLLGYVSESMFGHVSCATTSQVWQRFGWLFVSQSKIHLLHLCAALLSTKKEDSSIGDYFLKMKEIFHTLQFTGNPITDKDLLMYIFNGFGSESDAVVVNLTSHIELVTLQQLNICCGHEIRMEKLCYL